VTTSGFTSGFTVAWGLGGGGTVVEPMAFLLARAAQETAGLGSSQTVIREADREPY